MSYAFRCEICDIEPTWTIMRHGDVVVSWACPQHLTSVCERMQRDWQITELVVVLFAKSVEWNELRRTLDRVAREGGAA